MYVEQHLKTQGAWSTTHARADGPSPQLVLAFGSTRDLRDAAVWGELKARFPSARIVGCSTAGEILGTHVMDDSVTATAIAFEDAEIALASALLVEAQGASLGALLGSRLPAAGLVHVLVFSDGLHVNGSELVSGLASVLPGHVTITGGLAADGPRFERTAVCLDGPSPSEQVVAVGLYGARLRIGCGSLGGWDPFGPERRISKSCGNVLYELDGEPALDLYKRYLGEHAAGLPASGLLFPLAIRSGPSDSAPVVRTILSIDEDARTLTFAGDVPVGFRARLMRANFERLVDGACGAAKASLSALDRRSAQLALLISCVGRKLVLRQRVEDEVEGVRDVLGPDTVMTGFYSYGEISPLVSHARCELHNQTMTITVIAED